MSKLQLLPMQSFDIVMCDRLELISSFITMVFRRWLHKPPFEEEYTFTNNYPAVSAGIGVLDLES